jgi:hypothetical protein
VSSHDPDAETLLREAQFSGNTFKPFTHRAIEAGKLGRYRIPVILISATRCIHSPGALNRRAQMREDELRILENIREFERTFQQRYGRKMNNEELHLLHVAREIIKQKSAAENLRQDAA